MRYVIWYFGKITVDNWGTYTYTLLSFIFDVPTDYHKISQFVSHHYF